MNLLLQRTHASGPRTFGKLFADGVHVCYTLEDEVRERPGLPVADWKIRGATAIPSTLFVGKPYRVALQHSPRFGPDTLTVLDVPGFTHIRMHAGNTVLHTEGCPLLGAALSAEGIAPGTSRPAVELVRHLVRRGSMGSGRVHLTISNITEVA